MARRQASNTAISTELPLGAKVQGRNHITKACLPTLPLGPNRGNEDVERNKLSNGIGSFNAANASLKRTLSVAARSFEAERVLIIELEEI